MNFVIPINLAVEDPLSEAVLRKILQQSEKPFTIGSCYNGGGNDYLKKTIRGFNNAAKAGIPFLVLTDLDKTTCPLELLENWLPEPRHPNLIFRIAVREVEAWLLAHREAFAKFFSVSKENIPLNVDELIDLKQFLINLIRKSRKREFVQYIVPPKGSTRQQGPNYNEPLIRFVRNSWEVDIAKENSNSLKRAVAAIVRFELNWEKS